MDHLVGITEIGVPAAPITPTTEAQTAILPNLKLHPQGGHYPIPTCKMATMVLKNLDAKFDLWISRDCCVDHMNSGVIVKHCHNQNFVVFGQNSGCSIGYDSIDSMGRPVYNPPPIDPRLTRKEALFLEVSLPFEISKELKEEAFTKLFEHYKKMFEVGFSKEFAEPPRYITEKKVEIVDESFTPMISFTYPTQEIDQLATNFNETLGLSFFSIVGSHLVSTKLKSPDRPIHDKNGSVCKYKLLSGSGYFGKGVYETVNLSTVKVPIGVWETSKVKSTTTTVLHLRNWMLEDEVCFQLIERVMTSQEV